MKNQVIKHTQHVGRGRPRLAEPNVRIECMVPRRVIEVLIMREKLGHGYRTRIAARVLCEWAKSVDGSTPQTR